MKLKFLLIITATFKFTYCSAQENTHPNKVEHASESPRTIIRTSEARLGNTHKNFSKERIVFDGPERRSIPRKTRKADEKQSPPKVFVGPERQSIKAPMD